MNKEELVQRFRSRYYLIRRESENVGTVPNSIEKLNEALKIELRISRTKHSDYQRNFDVGGAEKMEKYISELENELQKEITQEEFEQLCEFAKQRKKELHSKKKDNSSKRRKINLRIY